MPPVVCGGAVDFTPPISLSYSPEIAMHRCPARARALVLAAALSLLVCSCRSVGFPEGECEENGCHPAARVCNHPTMHALACDLDFLEAHIDKYGSVVAAQPDVWGQARLTKYREEFENEMLKDLPNFKDTLQADVTRSDQAYFANALAISAAVSGRQAGLIPPAKVVVQNTTATPNTTVVTPAAITVPDATPDTGVFKGFDSIKRTDPRAPLAMSFTAATATGGISLEPTIVLEQKARYINYLNQIRRNNEGDDTADSPGYSLNLVRIPVSVLPGKCTQQGSGSEITFTMTPFISDELLPTTFRQLVMNDLVDLLALPVAKVSDLVTKNVATGPGSQPVKSKERKQEFDRFLGAGQKVREQFEIRSAFKSISSSARQRTAVLPLPPSQLDDVLGFNELLKICQSVDATIIDHQTVQGSVYILDARTVLRDELSAAYELLATTNRGDLWSFCTPMLTKAIRSGQTDLVWDLRDQFMKSLSQMSDTGDKKITITSALAWAIIVESALLNERLIQDIREATAAKGCACQNAEQQQFFLPSPMLTPMARQVFNEYVRCRWPIHVFTLDPITQDQNIADAYSRRQEMQLALSLAFVSGNISARNMTRYARRLEEDMDTIRLNRTQVGFSHGADTFGWRFYPRLQTPEFESNFTSLFRDQLIGGPNRNMEMRQLRLEPGMRECVAIVMMPSFVPYVHCSSSSNWFKLTNPKRKEFDLAYTVRMGRIVKSVQTCSTHVQNADCYRDGDLGRLMAKARQLEAKLPLQDTMVQVPYENTLGGFEMFNTGITDLAPQLRGWYGGPGVNANQSTTLFLVGDHFSVHQTRVIAGGKQVEYELLSRQIMKVNIPSGTVANTRKVEGKAPKADGSNEERDFTYVDVHVATPYGVTSHLEIPVVSGWRQVRVGSGFLWGLPTDYAAQYTFDQDATTKKNVFKFKSGSTVLPPNLELVVMAPANFLNSPLPTTATLYVTLSVGKKTIPAPLAMTLTYDSKRNAFFLPADQFAKNNSALSGTLETYFGNSEPTNPVVVSGQLQVNTAVFAVDNRLTVSLTRAAVVQ
jgi:hypothetical protein